MVNSWRRAGCPKKARPATYNLGLTSKRMGNGGELA